MKINKSFDLPKKIYAEASVHSIGGISVFDSESRITAESVVQFFSKQELLNKAVEKLKVNGFEVLHVGDIGISIAAPPETYEKVFNTSIVTKERDIIGVPGKKSTTMLDSTNSKKFGLIDTKNSPLNDVLEGIAISEHAFFYEALEVFSEQISNIPPKKNFYHLIPPDDLIKLLSAEKVHQSGITGRDIKVVMVDTGFYMHPYFEKNDYKINPVVLGEGAVNPERDEVSHGTGESVNVFSLAPNVNFTMVKMLFPLDAFRKAVDLNPDIITCSWGIDKRGQNELTDYEKLLEAEICNAVRSNITTIFSTGNGHEGFPGMHPDVISAGGVFVNKDGTMEATPYASGYSSHIYNDRKIPDVCGLVGLPPKAAYIMSPVEPGSEIDVELSQKHYPEGDETSPDDGWAAISGTSAAAPQIAGICALIKEVNSDLGPHQIREILKQTSRDVIYGRSRQNNAHSGPDLATGYGLVHASNAIEEAIRLKSES